MTIKEQLTKAQEEITSLQNDLASVRKDASDSAEALTGLKNERDQLAADLQAEKAAHAKTVEGVQISAQEIEQLKTKLTEAEKSAGKVAQEKLAAIGVPAVAAEVKPEEQKQFTSKAEAIKELERLSKEDPAKAREFYLKHKPLIIK